VSSWGALEQELTAWQADGKRLAVWWRDDDACEDSAALQRLLELAAAQAMPLLLAVIPARLQRSFIAALTAAPQDVFICQHGYAHENHAPPAAKKMELCARPFGSDDFDAAATALVTGAACLTAALDATGDSAMAGRRLPVLVPPWNRIEQGLVDLLPALGFEGLSTFGPRPRDHPAPMVQVNCHLDIFQWKPARAFRGEGPLLDQVTADLQRLRKTGTAQDEPFGLLTHHLVHDEDCWGFLDRFFALLRHHPTVQLPRPADLFSPPHARGNDTVDATGSQPANPEPASGAVCSS